MKSFEEEYRNRLDRMSVPPDFAATVRGRAAAQTPHAERERPQFVAAAAQASSEKQGRPQRLDASAASMGADRRRCRRIDATLAGVVAESGSGGYAVYYRRGDPIASRYCYDASFQIDLTCIGNNIERVDYEILGTNGLVASTDAGWVGEYPAPDGFDGLTYFRLEGETDANGAPLFGDVTSFSVSATEATTDARRRLMIVTPMTPDRDALAYELGASATPETQDEIDMQICDLGLASCYDRLADARIAVTAHFTDGSEQTKVYRIRLVGDADEEVAKRRESQLAMNGVGAEAYRPAFVVEKVAD